MKVPRIISRVGSGALVLKKQAAAHLALHRSLKGLTAEEVGIVKASLRAGAVEAIVAEGSKKRDVVFAGRFILWANHDWRNSMMAIASFADAIAKDETADDSIKEHAKKLRRIAGNLYTMLEFIQCGSLIDLMLKPQKNSDFWPVILADLQALFYETYTKPFIIFSDNVQDYTVDLSFYVFKFAIFNVVLNSFEHGAFLVKIQIDRIGDSLKIQIVDDGAGFEGTNSLVFGREGHGFGLPHARAIIAKHHGTLEIESPVDLAAFQLDRFQKLDGHEWRKGCLVTILLPLAE